MLKGTIVENSLADKEILKKIIIEKTYQEGDWTLHNVWVDEEQISGIAKSLADGPWYVHFWQPGQDDVIVIFKNKTFSIKFSDKSTWVDAVTHGKSLGIPPEQLDFPID